MNMYSKDTQRNKTLSQAKFKHSGFKWITTGAHSPVGGNLEFGGWIGMNVDGTVGFHSEGATRDSARDRL